MHNFEDMIEKYKRDLLEFSKQNAVHTDAYEAPQRQTADVMAQPVSPSQPDEANAPEAVISGRVPFADYDEFIADNRSEGILRVQVFAANGSFPVPNATVRVYVQLDDGEREVFSGITDVDGIADGIRLPAPDSSISFDENSTVAPYAVYKLRVERQGYAPAYFEGIPVFDSVKSIQPVGLVPLSADSSDDPTVVPNEPEALFGGER